MKRLLVTILFFTACVTVAGCRRGASRTPREPIDLRNKGDFIKGDRESKRTFQARSDELKAPIWIQSLADVDAALANRNDESQKKAFIQKLVSDQKDWEKDTKRMQDVAKLRGEREKERAEAEFLAFGKYCYEFLKTTPRTNYALKNFLIYCKRNDAAIEQKYLNTASAELVIYRIPIDQVIEERQMAFVPFAELDREDFVIAYVERPDKGVHRAMFADGKVKLLKPEQVAVAASEQELRLVALLCGGYCQTLKRDEKPSDSRFLEYLKEKAPWPITKDLDDKVIALNLGVDWREPGQILACRAQLEVGNKNIPPNHPTVDYRGNITYVAAEALPWMPKVAPKKVRALPAGGGDPTMPDMPIP